MTSVSVTATGFENIINEWDKFEDDLNPIIRESVDESFSIIANAMRTNVTSMFNKGYMTGVLLESISHTVKISKDDNAVFGSVGVYDMSRKTGSTDRRATAVMIANFYEKGIRPHSLLAGTRLEGLPSLSSPRGRRARGEQTDIIHPGSPPIPFLTRAFDANSQHMGPAMVRGIDKRVERL